MAQLRSLGVPAEKPGPGAMPPELIHFRGEDWPLGDEEIEEVRQRVLERFGRLDPEEFGLALSVRRHRHYLDACYAWDAAHGISPSEGYRLRCAARGWPS